VDYFILLKLLNKKIHQNFV